MKRSFKNINNQKMAPYLFITPFFILFTVFALYPILYSIVISFFKWNPPRHTDFIGLTNYGKILSPLVNPEGGGDIFFRRALGNTVWLLIFGSFTQHLVAIPLAIALNKKMRGNDFFKTVYFLPYITSIVAITIIFGQLFDTNYGLVNFVIENLFGGERVRWLAESNFVKPSLAIIINWRYIGWNTVIYLAGLQSIPKELYEAANVDGATSWQSHLRITLPLLVPIIFMGITLSISGGMQVFDEPFNLLRGYENNGGPGSAGLTAAFYIMRSGFRLGKFGRASAAAWVLFLIILLFTLINRMVTNRLDQNKH